MRRAEVPKLFRPPDTPTDASLVFTQVFKANSLSYYHDNVVPNPYLFITHENFAAFTDGQVYIGFVVNKMALGQVLRFSPLSIIPLVLHTHTASTFGAV
jgi:hypothetical protein